MKKLSLLFAFILILTGCKNDRYSSSYSKDGKRYHSDKSSPNSEVDYSHEEPEVFEGFENGAYTATVDYYNSKTGYRATYTLDVDIEDNEVTVIYFPKGGYIDDDNIWSEELDEDGYAEVEGEGGKFYEVQIDY
jgi:hypothetical protein